VSVRICKKLNRDFLSWLFEDLENREDGLETAHKRVVHMLLVLHQV
jgi:hypothetical protein